MSQFYEVIITWPHMISSHWATFFPLSPEFKRRKLFLLSKSFQPNVFVARSNSLKNSLHHSFLQLLLKLFLLPFCAPKIEWKTFSWAAFTKSNAFWIDSIFRGLAYDIDIFLFVAVCDCLWLFSAIMRLSKQFNWTKKFQHLLLNRLIFIQTMWITFFSANFLLPMDFF